VIDIRPGSRNAALIYVAGFVRSATVGLVGVVLAIYLSQTGLSTAAIGVVIGSGLAGAAVATLIVGFYSDTIGRRRTLMTIAILSALGYLAFAVSNSFPVLIAVAFFGMVNGMGRDRGAASALEQAILPETTGPERRTLSLAWYNLGLDIGHACGALAAVLPTVLISWLDIDRASAHRWTFFTCAALNAATAVLYAGLSQRVEIHASQGVQPGPVPMDRSTRRNIGKLAALFAIDSIGGGLLSSALIAYWFFRRYGLSETELGVLFFAARVLNAASHLMAAWLARRIGLVNTMVFTHLPSSLFLIATPFAPSGLAAAGLFLAREALVEMDVPTRQSYVMAIVRPEERTFASGATNVTRTVAWAIGSTLAGSMMQQMLAAPLFVGGALKIVYDLVLYRAFRHIRPPEESVRMVVAQ
jgi:MFS family permease